MRRGAAADADRTLSAALADVHQLAGEALRQLDTIGEEIEAAVDQHHLLALDTPEGAREFQRFLLTKQREISTIVTDAVALSQAKAVELQGLLDSYPAGSGATAEG
ncbi:hypothetical protein BH11ACT7_BH11ACT7_23380 [soil metagenome]